MREIFVPENFVFNSIDECLNSFPEQAVSILYDREDTENGSNADQILRFKKDIEAKDFQIEELKERLKAKQKTIDDVELSYRKKVEYLDYKNKSVNQERDILFKKEKELEGKFNFKGNQAYIDSQWGNNIIIAEFGRALIETKTQWGSNVILNVWGGAFTRKDKKELAEILLKKIIKVLRKNRSSIEQAEKQPWNGLFLEHH